GLRALTDWDRLIADYATTGVAIEHHPMELLREEMQRRGAITSRDLDGLPHGRTVRIGGMVMARQRPGTAKGVSFLLLEDEFGTINLIVPPPVYERHRLTVRSEPLLLARGRLEKLPIAGGALNVYVRDLQPLAAPAMGAGDVVTLPERGAGPVPEAVPALAAVG